MHQRILTCLVLSLVCLGAPLAQSADTTNSPATSQKFIYVLVHGSNGGGWGFKEVDRLLCADGHKVYRPTLTGLGERSHLASTNIDLDTHIQDIVNVILWEDLHDVVLVGHSYGGMVITGVADRLPDRIQRVIYIDAMLPQDGECAAGIRKAGVPVVKDGFIFVPAFKGNPPLPHDVSQPARTYSEPISLTNQAVARKLPTTYILTVDKGGKPEDDDFFKFYQRAQTYDWQALIMEGDHNIQRSHPEELVALLENCWSR
jgi:pimeloyl-ACP methyl ester carboxylesterase